MAFDEAYDKIDWHLRNTLDDTDYAEFSVALDEVCRASPASVPEGYALVPVDPTPEMWAAVNKLDDEMAAGGYDGKGCSIEQAWNCLLAAAPTPPSTEDRKDAERWRWITREGRARELRIPANENKASIDAAIDGNREKMLAAMQEDKP